MPHARATEPIELWLNGIPVFFQPGDVVDGDIAVFVLDKPDLPFEEIADKGAPAPKPKRQAKKASAPAPEA